MFTGLVKTTAKIVDLSKSAKGLKLSLKLKDAFTVGLGDSICVNGVCLTVVNLGEVLEFDVISETLSRTNLGDLEVGDLVNIEPSMRLTDLVGGHLVSGHVDFVSKLIEQNNDDFWFEIEPGYEKYFVEKGSVCINGVSLTVAEVDGNKFKVCLIPETLSATNLSSLDGKMVNIEIDLIARYLEKLV